MQNTILKSDQGPQKIKLNIQEPRQLNIEEPRKIKLKILNQETNNQETNNQETNNQETNNQETNNQEINNQETNNQEINNQETNNQEINNQEINNQEINNQEINNQEINNQEINNQETNNKEANNQETDNQETNNKEANNKISEEDVINLGTYLMFDGSIKKPEDLKIGDELMGDDSTPCKILNISKIVENNYIVKPVKGDSFVVAESDILSLTFSGNKKTRWNNTDETYEVDYFDKIYKIMRYKTFSASGYKSKEIAYLEAKKFEDTIPEDHNYFDITVKDYLAHHNTADFKIYRGELDFPHKEFEIDPYIIGIWLGDGSTGAPHITSADEEIVNYFISYFDDFGLAVKTDGIRHRVTSDIYGSAGRNPFLNYLREKEIFRNKHIPMEFLLTSRENRLKLLAGLLDSDGSLADNVYDFIQKRERLFDEVIFLARSLGFSCYKSPCVKFCTNGANGPVAGNYFRCSISGEGLEEIPTLLNRKKAHERRQIKRAYVTGITLKGIGEMENYRIVTDKPRYLMGDFTIRHRYEILEKIKEIPKEKITLCPFGYKKNFYQNCIEIDDDEANIVKMIFEEYHKGASHKNIALKLNELGKKSRKINEWNIGNIATIIGNKEKYLGALKNLINSGDARWPIILDKKYEKDPSQSKKGSRCPLGYVKTSDGIKIDESEAKTVRMIFEETDKRTPRTTIVEKLNKLGIKTRENKEWKVGSVGTILKHKNKYLGESIYLNDEKWPIILKKEA